MEEKRLAALVATLSILSTAAIMASVEFDSVQKAAQLLLSEVMRKMHEHEKAASQGQWRWVVRVVMICYLFLGFVEKPWWCRDPHMDYQCKVNTSEGEVEIPWSNLPKLSIPITHSIELLCISYLLLPFLLTHKPKTLQYYIAFATFLAAVCDNVAALVTLTNSYVSQFLKPVVLWVAFEAVRKCWKRIGTMLYMTKEAMVLILLHIVGFAWMGCVMFQDTSEGLIYFPDLTEAMWSLLVLLTTCNYPDVMMPAVAQNRLYSLFFIVYLLVGLFFLLNLVLAVLYSNFKRQLNDIAAEYLDDQNVVIHKAYNILRSEGNVSPSTVISLLTELRATTGPTIALDRYLRILSSRPADSEISEFEFEQAFLYLSLSSSLRRSRPTSLARAFTQPCLPVPALRRVLTSVYFEATMNLLNLINSMLIVSSVTFGLQEKALWGYMQLGFLAFFWAEMSIKMAAFGLRAYTRLWRNRFEIAMNLVSLALVYYVFGQKDWSASWKFILAVVLLRLLRVLVLLGRVDQFHRIYQTFTSMLPIFVTELSAMVVTYYTFGEIGVALFGGQIYPENPSILADATVPLSYVYNNFNDLPSGLVTLFELIVVNNWWVIVEMYEDVNTKVVRLFFIAYYVMAVLVCLNLMIALTMDVYNLQETQEEKENEEQS